MGEVGRPGVELQLKGAVYPCPTANTINLPREFAGPAAVYSKSAIDKEVPVSLLKVALVAVKQMHDTRSLARRRLLRSYHALAARPTPSWFAYGSGSRRT
jgi:hypothetical protein